MPPPAERDDVGGWGAFQSRSYFAVQLSPRWWLWGLDSQLDAPDRRRAAGLLPRRPPAARRRRRHPLHGVAELAGGRRRAGCYAALADTPFYTLLWFVDRVLGADRGRIRLMLTGDEHHYARYSPPPPPPIPTRRPPRPRSRSPRSW